MSVTASQLETALNELLQPDRFKDYCPNGLQVEGRADIAMLYSGVTASQALIDRAVADGVDAILVHHGYFWRGEDPRLVGMKGRRIRTLVTAGINLFAYHLPMDCHPVLGNNAGLGKALGLQAFGPLDVTDASLPVFSGGFAQPLEQSAVAARLSEALGRPVLSEGEGLVRRVAWCTGGGQGYIDTAAAAGVDLFVTGEVSEQTIHSAREQGVGFIAAGHHATERFGPQSVGKWVANEFGIEHQFIDIDNPA